MPGSDSDDITQTHIQLLKDTTIGHYRIIERIGAGGMGEVYLAEDTTLNRKVALKFLPSHLCQDSDCRARFKREAQAAAKLDHPNIVAVHEVGEYQGRPFFSMQHVEGQSLKEVIAGKSLSLERILEIGIQVCDGLQVAHENGITHRDIKPSNILIDSHGRARIVDFGLASVIGSDHLTKIGSTLGTIGYMSPEQVRGDKVDYRTDLFSFGVVLYEMITGHAPFKADSEAATLHAIINARPELIARFRREVPSTLQTIIDKALDKNVTTRYQHADELVADLKRLFSSSNPDRNVASRKQRIVVLALLCLILVMFALVFKPWRLVTGPSEEGAAVAKSVVIMPYKNLTGDASLNPLGRMVADWTTQSLLQTELADVVPPEVLSERDAEKGIQSLIKSTGATYLVTGSYYRIRDSIQFQTQVFNSEGKLLRAIEPIYASSTNVMNGVEEVRQRVLVALAAELDYRVQERWVLGSRIPRFDAYQEFIRGEDLFVSGNDFAASLEAFNRAYALDTSFILPLVHASYAHVNLGQYDQLDTLIRFLDQHRPLLGRLELLAIDELKGWQSGNLKQALAAMRQAGKLAPKSTYAYDWGLLALLNNRPGECIEAYKELDPENQSDWYWSNLADAYHRLGEHEKELEIAREGRRLFPTLYSTFKDELCALASLGRKSELQKLIEEQSAITGTHRPASTRRYAAEELRAHGYEEEAMTLLNEALSIFESLPADSLRSLRSGYALTLYYARRWVRAKDVYRELLSETSKDSADSRYYEIYLGFIAARQGDRVEAMRVFDWKKNQKAPYNFGGNTYERACILAILGEKEQAVSLLKESFLQGYRYHSGVHKDFDLELLWTYPPYIELMKPK